MEFAQEAEEVAGIVGELENEIVRPTDVMVEAIRHDAGLQASAILPVKV